MIFYSVGDTAPPLIFDPHMDGNQYVLAGVLSATLQVWKPSGDTFDITMDIDDVTNLLQATFEAGSLDEVGLYEASILLILADGSRQHSLSGIPITVRPQYGRPS